MDPLLEQYQFTRDPAAFRRIVDAHIDAVYSQCVRQLQDRHLAEDVTQAVFFMLAQKANKLPSDTVLGGWLFTAARYACLNARRGKLRRRRHEQEAAEMRSEILEREDAAQRDEIERSLNDAVARLDRRDRDAVILRFFQQLPMAEVGQRLGVSEMAARQRVSRAIARLRRTFAASGVALAEPGVERALQSFAIIKAPAALAVLAAQAGAGNSAASTIGGAALKMMGAASKVKASIAACAMVAGVITVSAAAIVAMEQGPGAANARAASQPAPATAPAVNGPLAGETTDAAELTVQLADVLLDIAKTYRKHDMAAAKQCFFVDDSVQSRLILAKFEEEVNEWWLRRAWAATFPEQRSKVLADIFGEGGHGDDDDFEAAANRLLESGAHLAVVDGDRATLPLTDVDPHAVITVYFRRIDGRWRLDLGGTFRATLGNPSHPLTGQAMERAADGYIQRNELINAFSATVARELETGVYETADSAEAVLAERAKSLPLDSKINVWANHRK